VGPWIEAGADRIVARAAHPYPARLLGPRASGSCWVDEDHQPEMGLPSLAGELAIVRIRM
jgi:hypothetical protein